VSRKRHLRAVPSPVAPAPRPHNLPEGTRRRLIRDPRGWLAAGFGAGFSPWAPGTVASIAAVVPWWFGLSGLPVADYLGVVALAFLVGLWAARWTIRESRVEDPPLVVWDEVVGVWLALAVVPREWPWVLAAVVLFRVFDIAKPWPVGWADRRVKGAFGTMLDDLLAGLMVAGLMAVAVALAPTVETALAAP
jgi:phosphatidylglycerophosphatase A